MRRPFTLPRAHVVDADGLALMQEVTRHTESAEAAASILRSLERLGSDASIRHYEVTPTTIQRTYRDAPPVVWSVRAVRG
jgi:hypothetical protein